MSKAKKDKNNKKGDNFIEEPLGSATMINLDGQWEHDFTDHEK